MTGDPQNHKPLSYREGKPDDYLLFEEWDEETQRRRKKENKVIPHIVVTEEMCDSKSRFIIYEPIQRSKRLRARVAGRVGDAIPEPTARRWGIFDKWPDTPVVDGSETEEGPPMRLTPGGQPTRPGVVETHESGLDDALNSGHLDEAVERMIEEDEGDDEVFTIGEHSIPEVKTFVDDNPDMATEVLEIERDGRARKGLITWLRARAATDSA